MIVQAVGMFAVTNIDDLVVLAVFFGRGAAWRVVAGQYIGFLGILAVAVVGALGAGLLPESVIPWLGLLPIALGVKSAWQAWRDRHDADDDGAPGESVGPLQVAAVTFANGGDNIGVYVPVFTVAGVAGMSVYAAVFLVGVGVWCAAGWFLATRPPVAKALSRWGHVVLPVVLIGIGVVILTGL
jgi:cadmium resistance protein CadD (predicted permease)